MIGFVQGNIRIIRKESVVIDVQGVGYEVFVANPYGFKKEDNVFLYTYHQVREDASLLFGFLKEADYEVFIRLINVKGIGPKTALNLFSACSGAEMIEAIENDDVKRLKALPGIGAKTASQIVLDLKGKFVSVETSTETKTKNPVWDECQEALIALGYRANQLGDIKKELAPREDLNVDSMLRLALGMIAKRKGGF